MKTKIHIKNMVCPRCIESVGGILTKLKIEFSAINLGEVDLIDAIDTSLKVKLEEELKNHGFELLEDYNSSLISKIKGIIIHQIHHEKEILSVNFSTLLSEELHQNYASLSRLFSSVEGLTVEKFILKQKIEKVKEYITYNELTFSEIAFKMGYSSVAHLSSQFKKETGMSPSVFKKNQKNNRNFLNEL